MKQPRLPTKQCLHMSCSGHVRMSWFITNKCCGYQDSWLGARNWQRPVLMCRWVSEIKPSHICITIKRIMHNLSSNAMLKMQEMDWTQFKAKRCHGHLSKTSASHTCQLIDCLRWLLNFALLRCRMACLMKSLCHPGPKLVPESMSSWAKTHGGDAGPRARNNYWGASNALVIPVVFISNGLPDTWFCALDRKSLPRDA